MDSYQNRLRILLWDPGALQTLRDMFRLLSHITDVRAFRDALNNEGWDEAQQYTDLSHDEFLQRTNSLRQASLQLFHVRYELLLAGVLLVSILSSLWLSRTTRKEAPHD